MIEADNRNQLGSRINGGKSICLADMNVRAAVQSSVQRVGCYPSLGSTAFVDRH